MTNNYSTFCLFPKTLQYFSYQSLKNNANGSDLGIGKFIREQIA